MVGNSFLGKNIMNINYYKKFIKSDNGQKIYKLSKVNLDSGKNNLAGPEDGRQFKFASLKNSKGETMIDPIFSDSYTGDFNNNPDLSLTWGWEVTRPSIIVVADERGQMYEIETRDLWKEGKGYTLSGDGGHKIFIEDAKGKNVLFDLINWDFTTDKTYAGQNPGSLKDPETYTPGMFNFPVFELKE